MGYKTIILIQKSIIMLYLNIKQLDHLIFKIKFTIENKTTEYLRLNLTIGVQDLYT